jgi:hypothetical protein
MCTRGFRMAGLLAITDIPLQVAIEAEPESAP